MTAPNLVNPFIVGVGATVHLTPLDQNNNPIALTAGMTVKVAPAFSGGYPAAIVTQAQDATGVNVTGVEVGSGLAVLSVTNGADTVASASFTLTVPWSVTAVGSESP